jgi:class III poly(R)-hydroxyalkanoic acid synthase PhaE subunit
MNWNNRAEAMLKAWTEAQKKIWENWRDMAEAAPVSPFFTPGLVDQWRKMAAQGVQAWTAAAEPTAKETARRLFTIQETFVHFMEFSAKAWKAIAARIEAGEAWQSVLAEHTEQLRQQLIGSPEKLNRAARDVHELWQLYLEEIHKLAQPWLASGQEAPGRFGKAVTGDGSALIELLNYYRSLYEHSFGHLLESPSLGYTRELNEKILKGFDLWQDFHQASLDYQILLAEAWVKTFERLQHELVALAEKGEAIQSLQELVTLWNDIGDAAFIELFSSERYIRAQGRLVNTTMAYRVQQREITELFFKINDIPTRSEVDEVHRINYQQNKELKSLKKALAEISTQVGALAGDGGPSLRRELDEARRTIEALRQEIKDVRRTLAEVLAAANQNEALTQEKVETLRRELQVLTESMAQGSDNSRVTPKSTRKSSSGQRKARTEGDGPDNSQEGR